MSHVGHASAAKASPTRLRHQERAHRLIHYVSNMPANIAKEPGRALGRNPDRLTLSERLVLAGKYIALEIYSPCLLYTSRCV